MDNPLASLLGLGGGGATTLAALASLAGSQIADGRGGGGGGRRDSGRDHDRDGGGTVGLNMTSLEEVLLTILGLHRSPDV